MSNPFFDAPNLPLDFTRAKSAPIRSQFTSIAAGFDGVHNRVSAFPATGTANALIVTLPNPPLSYVDGLSLHVFAAVANTGPATVNVNGLGVVPILTYDGLPLTANTFVIGAVENMFYQSSTASFRLASVTNLVSSTSKGLAPPSPGGTSTYLRSDGTWTSPSGNGTVTSVSVTTANGVSGTIVNPTAAAAITLSLGAITPTSVAASGTVTGSNVSGSNTGDQTITLTGDVTGAGSGSFAATIAPGVVTLAKQASIASGTVFYRTSAGNGAPEVMPLSTLKTDLGVASLSGTASALTVGGTLAVTGATTLTGNVVFSGAGPEIRNSAGTLQLYMGNAGNFAVKDYGGSDRLTVSNAGNVAVNNGLTVAGTFAVTGATTLSSTLAAGATTITGTLTLPANVFHSDGGGQTRLYYTGAGATVHTASAHNFRDAANGTQYGSFSATGLAVTGALSATGAFTSSGGTFALGAGQATYYGSATLGAVIGGYGSTNDVTITNRAGTTVMSVPATTVNATFAGTLTAGGLITATGGQIAFPATQVSSSGVNTLDDYEEGTWTAGVTLGGGSTGMVLNSSFVTGTYTKIGRLVHAQLTLIVTTKGSSTGAVAITGLPFPIVGNTGFTAFGGANFSGTIGTPMLGVSGSSLNLYSVINGNFVNLIDSNILDGVQMYFSFFYNAAT